MTDEPKLTYFADLIEYHARVLGEKPYILWDKDRISFAEFYKGTCRAANGLSAQGAKPGDGVAILMGNYPEYLYIFYGMPLRGFYSVPVNVSLKGEGLHFILNHSDVKYLIVDDTLYPKVAELKSPLEAIEKIFVRRTTEGPLPKGTVDLKDLLSASPEKPDHTIEEGAIAYMMYTSGTTGFPKGVVNRNRPGMVDWFRYMASLMINPEEDILYTCLPLFHANALILTAGWAMSGGVTFGLDKKFSASKFWDRIRHYGVTQFNSRKDRTTRIIPYGLFIQRPVRPTSGRRLKSVLTSRSGKVTEPWTEEGSLSLIPETHPWARWENRRPTWCGDLWMTTVTKCLKGSPAN
jgi:acyl-CoA synthetase (AMP-forming)/AMP-acid ligase II